MPVARVILWLASVAGLAMLARSLIIGPLPTWVTLLALFVYLGWLLLGALVPQLEMYADVFWRGDTKEPAVALTFDDGPDPDTTPRVLEILAEYEVCATFFVIGAKACAHPELLRRIVEAGHDLGLHGFRHNYAHPWWSPQRVARDIEQTREAVETATGVRSDLFRPPVGLVSPRTAAGARHAGVLLVAWSVRARDGLGRTSARAIRRRVEAGLEHGAIILLHDAAERPHPTPSSREPRAAPHPSKATEPARNRQRTATLEALPEILKTLRARALEPVTVRELAIRSGWLARDQG